MNKQLSILICAGAFAALPGTADAFNTHGAWAQPSTTMRAHRVSFPPGSAYRTALGTVVQRWNDNPSSFRFAQRYDDARAGLGNGQNEVWFSGDDSYDPAVCLWISDRESGDILEADVVFFNGESYTTSMQKTQQVGYGGQKRAFQTTAMHEYGHALGLLHEGDEYNIMGRDWTHLSLQSSTCRAYAGEDAGDGAVSLYGRHPQVQVEDLGVVHWRRTEAKRGYSIHELTRVFDSDGNLLPSEAFDGQRRYIVSPGQRVRPEFGYENNGETAQRPNNTFYISTNSTISSGDRAIGDFPLFLGRNDIFNHARSVTIPADLIVGQTYYLGVYVDSDRRISERSAANNSAYHIIRVE